MGTEVAKVKYNLDAPGYDRTAAIALDMASNKCFRTTTGVLRVRYPLPTEVRSTLAARAVVLQRALKDNSPNLKGAYIADMLGCYDPRPQTVNEMAAVVGKYLDELAAVPTWAVCIACAKIKAGTAIDVSTTYRPTTIQVRVLCRSVMADCVTENHLITEALNAPFDGAEPSKEIKDRVQAKLRTFSDELRTRVMDESRGIGGTIEARRINRARSAMDARSRSAAERAVLAEYKNLGIEPVYSGGVLVSPTLLRRLDRLPAAKRGKRQVVA
jgi:hypothetical protein